MKKESPVDGDYRIIFTLPSGGTMLWKYTDEGDRDSDYNALQNLQFPGDVTSADSRYVHDQMSASATWTVTHNLDCYPSVTIVNSAGDQVMGFTHYDDSNNITLTFSAAFAGKAYIN